MAKNLRIPVQKQEYKRKILFLDGVGGEALALGTFNYIYLNSQLHRISFFSKMLDRPPALPGNLMIKIRIDRASRLPVHSLQKISICKNNLAKFVWILCRFRVPMKNYCNRTKIQKYDDLQNFKMRDIQCLAFVPWKLLKAESMDKWNLIEIGEPKP